MQLQSEHKSNDMYLAVAQAPAALVGPHDDGRWPGHAAYRVIPETSASRQVSIFCWGMLVVFSDEDNPH